MLKKILITVIVLVVIIGVLGGIKGLQIKALIDSGGNFQLPPEFVTSAPVTEDIWKETLKAVGSLASVQGVTVTTEAAGKVKKIHFESGQAVTKDQLLVELDTTTEEAQLSAAKAEQQLAGINLERARKLRASNTVAQSELDSANSVYLSASAQVENLAALMAKKKIAAPFTGRLGLRQIDLGQFINGGEPIVSLQALDPIYVNFSFPQQWVSLVKVGMSVELKVDSYPDIIFGGELTAINPEVDVTTRTIGLQATLDNREEKLLPGMFCQVSVVLPESKPKIVVPSTAIVYASYGDSVFVINEKDGKKVVDQKFVRVGEARGDFVSITSGLEVGSSIVSTGAFKLRQGMAVELNNKLKTSPEINPKPSDS